ncbi:uncharacterized protein LOC130625396 [Hydractinia symbiolongicarpus]|uniref:uncharacterized protein LOC130625396 n=1 Tax=Hydractinia symbiolongicarpus TaxID=13093 RepID=UPI00254B4FE0|nr:uncharacterized protein LOC130625396 [Hydractinia symbiolongicarpus]
MFRKDMDSYNYACDEKYCLCWKIIFMPIAKKRRKFVMCLWKVKRHQISISGYYHGNVNCVVVRMLFSFGFMFVTVSITGTAFIASELFVAVFKPITFRVLIRKNTLSSVLAGIWCIFIVLPLIAVYVYHPLLEGYQFFFGVYSCFVFISIIICQVCVYKRLYRHNDITTSRHDNHKKSLKVAIKVLITHGICYLPAAICILYKAYAGNSSTLQTYVEQWTYLPAITNSFWNTFIYGFRSAEIRFELKRTLRRRLRRTGFVV